MHDHNQAASSPKWKGADVFSNLQPYVLRAWPSNMEDLGVPMKQGIPMLNDKESPQEVAGVEEVFREDIGVDCVDRTEVAVKEVVRAEIGVWRWLGYR